MAFSDTDVERVYSPYSTAMVQALAPQLVTACIMVLQGLPALPQVPLSVPVFDTNRVSPGATVSFAFPAFVVSLLQPPVPVAVTSAGCAGSAGFFVSMMVACGVLAAWSIACFKQGGNCASLKLWMYTNGTNSQLNLAPLKMVALPLYTF